METLVNTMPVSCNRDVVLARQAGRELAVTMGFSVVDQTRIATAISEITRNVIQHARCSGTITFASTQRGVVRGLQITVEDKGCGIADIQQAMADGFSTVGGLGAGLPASRRLMDEFEVTSRRGVGTTIRMAKWTKH